MEEAQDSQYHKGYIAGYRDGLRDAVSGKAVKMNESDLLDLPIKAMTLSTRASNCLSRAGCVYIADVVALSEQAIATMRNMGTKTALEIARWMDTNGISYSAWSQYL